MSTDPGDPQLQKFSELLASQNDMFLSFLMRAGILIIQLYIFSWLMYLVYRLFARENVTYSLVFQIMSYSSAPTVLGIVPVLGPIAGAIWSMWCLLVGCKSAIGLNWPQTILGLVPVFFVIAPFFAQILAFVQAGA